MTENADKLPSADQIKAAIELFKQIPGLERNDIILGNLGTLYRDFSDFYEVLLRALAINEFYSAGCPDIPEMTDHIRKIGKGILERHKKGQSDEDFIKIVEDIALLGNDPKKYGNGCVVFASKFAHFFVDPDAFPVIDDYSETILKTYFDDTYFIKDAAGKKLTKNRNRYRLYFKNFQKLKDNMLTSFADQDRKLISNKIVDQYLWLAGKCMKWKDKKDDTESEGKKGGRKDRIEEKFYDPAFKNLFDQLLGKS